jgi:hypothetical protein
VLRVYPSNSSMLESLNLRFITGRLSIDIIDEVLRGLFSLLRHIEYEYSVVDSTKVNVHVKLKVNFHV